ncbi:MAG TPA: hypothetical protein PLP21_13510 [Pyrinomonadaceae bacterium]|nr:hypothetical protein [Acidobacteriota bacterium]HQZ97334.1 hypothetical protein [Pyrinomonadaceae bacterium]
MLKINRPILTVLAALVVVCLSGAAQQAFGQESSAEPSKKLPEVVSRVEGIVVIEVTRKMEDPLDQFEIKIQNRTGRPIREIAIQCSTGRDVSGSSQSSGIKPLIEIDAFFTLRFPASNVFEGYPIEITRIKYFDEAPE